MGHTPSTAGTFRKKFRKNFRKTPETLSERFLEFRSRVRLGSPKPYNSRHLRLPEFSPPPVRLGTPLFSEAVPERASQSRSWNSQQYWGHVWTKPFLVQERNRDCKDPHRPFATRQVVGKVTKHLRRKPRRATLIFLLFLYATASLLAWLCLQSLAVKTKLKS